MSKRYQLDYESPIGIIEIFGNEEGIYSILFSEKDTPEHFVDGNLPKPFIDCFHQLEQYFSGSRQDFTFPYLCKGTDFQKTVWTALTKIPYGETASYKDIAVSIGKETAVRAIGHANGQNKLSIVVPCHRIVGSNGNLTGYAGGLWRKEWLLKHEKGDKVYST